MKRKIKKEITINLETIVNELKEYGFTKDNLKDGFSSALVDILEDNYGLERNIFKMMQNEK